MNLTFKSKINKIMDIALLNHRTEVAKLAQVVNNRHGTMYAIDVNRWGVSEPFSDPENSTIYRKSIDELAYDTFVSENEEMDHTHYPNAAYESIFDY